MAEKASLLNISTSNVQEVCCNVGWFLKGFFGWGMQVNALWFKLRITCVHHWFWMLVCSWMQLNLLIKNCGRKQNVFYSFSESACFCAMQQNNGVWLASLYLICWPKNLLMLMLTSSRYSSPAWLERATLAYTSLQCKPTVMLSSHGQELRFGPWWIDLLCRVVGETDSYIKARLVSQQG